MKKIANCLFVAVFVLSLITIFTAVVSADSYTGDTENFVYEVNADGETIKITDYIGSVDYLTVPSTIDGYDVTVIASNAFLDCTTLKGLIIPDSVDTIENSAFKNVSSLEELTVPFVSNTITSDVSGTDFGILFGGSSSGYLPETLEKVTITKATMIPKDAFSGCSKIKTIILPETLTSIGSKAFYYCTALSYDINFPSGVTEIGSQAFYNCAGLTGALTLPSGLTTIENNVFDGCKGLFGSITIPDGVTSIGSNAFYNCSGLIGNLVFPETVRTIGDNAFRGCVGITSIYIPDSVTTIGNTVFGGLTAVEEITMPFVGKTATTDTLGVDFAMHFGGSSGSYVPTTLKKVTITDTDFIPNDAFKDCKYIETIIIPETITKIGNYALIPIDVISSNKRLLDNSRHPEKA